MKPKVTLIMAMTADGFITKHEDGLVNWTSKEDKKHFSEHTKRIGAMIYGNATFKTFNKPLPGRLNIVMTRTPEKFTPIPGQLEFNNAAPAELVKELGERGYKEIALTGGSDINALFLKEDLVDEIILTIEPLLFGSGKCLFAPLKTEKQLELAAIDKLNANTIALHYKVKRQHAS